MSATIVAGHTQQTAADQHLPFVSHLCNPKAHVRKQLELFATMCYEAGQGPGHGSCGSVYKHTTEAATSMAC